VRIEVLQEGALHFIRPDGRAFKSRVPIPVGNWTRLPALLREQGVHIGSAMPVETATTRGSTQGPILRRFAHSSLIPAMLAGAWGA